MRHIIPVSGKDSLATALVQRVREPELNYEFVYNDTAMELPETYQWLDEVEAKLGIRLFRIGKNLEQIIAEQEVLPSPLMRYCTKYSKIFPLRDWLAGTPATLYIGLRADEDRGGAKESKGLTVRYPLREVGIGLEGVISIVTNAGLVPPLFFWQRLHDAVVAELGSLAYIVKDLPPYLFNRVFAWRSRPNCFMCFYQRRYEWVGLLEFHPELFARAEHIETNTCHETNTRKKPYYFLGEDFPLSQIRARAGQIFQTRVDKLCKLFRARAQQDLFTEAMLDELDMAQTSCGMFCGK